MWKALDEGIGILIRCHHVKYMNVTHSGFFADEVNANFNVLDLFVLYIVFMRRRQMKNYHNKLIWLWLLAHEAQAINCVAN